MLIFLKRAVLSPNFFMLIQLGYSATIQLHLREKLFIIVNYNVTSLAETKQSRGNCQSFTRQEEENI